MVYNAMKLFMEINPQLFDDCSHEYTELRNSAEKREQDRKDKWDLLAKRAGQTKSGVATIGPIADSKTASNLEPIMQDSQQRLDALRLKDETNGVRPGEEATEVS